MSDIYIEKKDETFIVINAETSILYELRDYFSFYADGFKFSPKYRAKLWDGFIRLLRITSKNKGEIYYGLLFEILKFCKNREYSVEINKNVSIRSHFKEEDIKQFLQNINISSKGQKLSLRDYQEKGIIDSLKNKRHLIKSPTSSGKSAIVYSIIRHLEQNNLRGLILVPNLSLIHQLYNDFIDYSTLNDWNTIENVHKIFSGQDKESDKNIFLSTWQSLQNIKQNSFFEQFDYIICDECFSGDSKVLTPTGYVEIKNIKKGDVIINYSEKTKQFKCDVVEKLHKNISPNEKMYELTFDNKNTVKVTGNHKFLTTEGWVRADKLTEQHEIISYE